MMYVRSGLRLVFSLALRLWLVQQPAESVRIWTDG